ncbi:MAG: UDP-3-O-(3-hydroxymyristoyl)glucosamine N-acyltransferase [Verrucomicrobia bacterium]|nr:UDP-3-O-(3-hydroxymyristoyl)glucosamine N-acyltransferase [Verrucomicrobiota bacterium]
MPYTVNEIAAALRGEVAGDGSTVLTGFAPAAVSRPGDLTFAENEEYLAQAEASQASAVLVGLGVVSASKVLIRVRHPRLAFARVLPWFFPEPAHPAGVHATAVVARSARVDGTAHIGPHCVIGEGVEIGARVVLEGGNHIGAECRLGADTHLFPNVVLYARTCVGDRVRIHAGSVVGSDGFGYVFDGGAHHKVPQVGNVVVHDDVEIGANVTIDRGALGSTIIGKGTKIDNLVMVAHNVVVGEHCILISQVGIAGSTSLGNYVTLAGQVGLAGHLAIGDQATVAAKSGVMHNIPKGEKWFGIPAQPDRQAKRQIIALHQLPELIRRVRDLEQRLQEREAPRTPPA